MNWIIQTCQLTPKTSCCIRIGHRLNKPCCCLTTQTGNDIVWSNSCKYLGVYLLAGRKFKCNFDEAKAKYHRAFDGIMGKIGRSASQEVIIGLVRMTCLPILLYDAEACHLAKKYSSSMEYILNCVFGKILTVSQQEFINECRKAFNFDNFNQVIKNRQLKFIAKLSISNNFICI